MKTSIYKLCFVLGLTFIASCEEGTDSCACYEKAINGSELSEECKNIVGDMTEEELKDKSNKCFENNIEDLSGAVGV